MPIDGFLALAFFPSPEFFFLTIAWDWVFTLFNTKYLLVGGGEAIDSSCPWLVKGREATGYLTPMT